MDNSLHNVQIFQPVALHEQIWAFRYKTTVTAFAVVSERYIVLIDTLINPAIAAVMIDTLRAQLADRQLLVVNTHADWDHCWGNAIFAGPTAMSAAPIIGHRLCRERMLSDQARQGLAQMQAENSEVFGFVDLVPPTITFDGSLMIDGGDLTLELIHTPGHTEDHVSIYVPQIRTLFAGDAAEMPLPFVPDAAALPILRASLERLRLLKAETVLYCHAETHVPELIDRNIAYFDDLEQRILATPLSLPVQDDTDLESLIEFSFDNVQGVDQLSEEERHFYRPAHHAAIRAMIEYVQRQ